MCAKSRKPALLQLYVLASDVGGSHLKLNDGRFVKLSQVGWGLMLCRWLGPPWFNQWFSLTLARSGFRFGQVYLSLFHHIDQFDFVSSPWCLDLVREPLCEPNFLCIFVLRNTSGPRVKFVDS